MKFIPFVIIVLLITGCRSEERVFSLNNTQAYAFDIGEAGWEVNITSVVRNFQTDNENGQYFLSLHYKIDIITPEGDSLNNFYENDFQKNSDENINDTRLEAQFELERTYSPGIYQALFEVTDNLSGQTALSSTSFNIEGEEIEENEESAEENRDISG
jgi:hypothetical protein